MQDNPFDDPEVQSAAMNAAAPVGASVAADPAVQSAAWNASANAFSSGSDPKSAIASDPAVQKAVMGAVVGHYTGSKAAPPPPPAATHHQIEDNAYENGGWDPESNQPKGAPEEKTWGGACIGFCGAFSARLPLRYLLVLFGVLLVIGGIVDFITNFKTALDLFVNCYLIVFGILIMFIEWPRMTWNAKVQETILYWAYFLARLWGRGMLYIFLCILCVSDSKSAGKMVAGVLGFFIVFIMYFVSYTAAQKMKRINIFVSRGSETEQRLVLIKQKFQELDMASMGSIGGEAVLKVADQADRKLSFSEKEAILRFFNPNFENDITIEEWMNGFETTQKGLRLL